LAIVCPVTTHGKGYPFEVAVPSGCAVTGVILADHVRSVDWRARRATPVEGSSPEVVEDVLARLAPLLGF
jgi:mRNA interferase MazF